jgi:hypothetical protein
VINSSNRPLSEVVADFSFFFCEFSFFKFFLLRSSGISGLIWSFEKPLPRQN